MRCGNCEWSAIRDRASSSSSSVSRSLVRAAPNQTRRARLRNRDDSPLRRDSRRASSPTHALGNLSRERRILPQRQYLSRKPTPVDRVVVSRRARVLVARFARPPLAPRAERPRASAFLISPIPSPFARSSVAAHQIIQKLAFTERFERSPRALSPVRARRRRRRRRLHDRPRRRPLVRAC